MKKIACPNCGRTIDSPYCPRCGQRYGGARLSWQTLWDGTMSTYLGEGFDGEKGAVERFGMLGTLWQTVRHPVRTISAFLAGHRRKYFNPFALLLLLSGFCALANSLFGIRYLDISLNPETAPDSGFRLSEYIKIATDYANSHPAAYLLLTIPFTALAEKWIFRPRKLRYIEFLYIGIFTSVLSVVVMFIMSFIPLELDPAYGSYIQSLPIFLVETAVFHNIFGHNIFRTAGNLLVAYGIAMILLTLATTVVFFFGGIIYGISTSA